MMNIRVTKYPRITKYQPGIVYSWPAGGWCNHVVTKGAIMAATVRRVGEKSKGVCSCCLVGAEADLQMAKFWHFIRRQRAVATEAARVAVEGDSYW